MASSPDSPLLELPEGMITVATNMQGLLTCRHVDEHCAIHAEAMCTEPQMLRTGAYKLKQKAHDLDGEESEPELAAQAHSSSAQQNGCNAQTHDDRTSDLHWVKVKVSDSSTLQVTDEEAGKTMSGIRLQSCPDADMGAFNSATADGALSEADVLSLAFMPAPSTPPRTPRVPSSPPPAPRRTSVVANFPPGGLRQSSERQAHASQDVSSIVAVGESSGRGQIDVVDVGTLNTRMTKLVECGNNTKQDLSGSPHVALHFRDIQPQLLDRANMIEPLEWMASAERRDYAAEGIAEFHLGVPEFPATQGPFCRSHAAPTSM